MLRIICAITMLSLLCQLAPAQDVYMPRNIKQAYKKGTRAGDGRPGKNYFQNRATYNITLDAMPPGRTIKGSAQIVYSNNSPDTLNFLVLRTIQNIHKPGALRYADVSQDYLTQGMTIDELMVNGETKNTVRNTPGTWKMVKLSAPLLPKSGISLSVKWHYDISLESAREGMLDSTTFFMAYAYPSICVYDDYNGWDMMEFTDLQEFYYDFNDYIVTVNVPQHYIVWGTGDLLNANEVLQPVYAQRLSKAASSDEVTSIISAEDFKSKNVTAANAVNSWKFKGTNIQDVAYAVSDHFVWDGSSVVVDDKTGRRASVHAAYRSSTTDFKKMAGWCNYSLRWFSKELPGVPYPFPKMTVVEGYADMEFPMLVNGIAHNDAMLTRRIGAEHEVAHSWFPFYMGINESRYAFMDEGWASFMEASIAYAYRPKEDALAGDTEDASAWSETPLDEVDLPIITPSAMLNGQAYQLNSYTKPMLAYRAAKDLLGDVLFKKCLHAYMQRWNGKHPTPWDFFYTFNNIAGKNLNHFWKGWFFDNSHIDYAIGKVSTTAAGITVAIKNAGGAPAPFDVLLTYADGSTETIHQTPALWAKGKTEAMVSIKTKQKVKMVEISGGVFVDADTANNTWEAK